MAERWAKPAKTMDLSEDEVAVWFDGQTWRPGITKTYDKETFERVCQGRVCIHCDEPQEVAWPEVCSLIGCGFEIRRYQERAIKVLFQGGKKLGPSTTIAAELDRLDDTAERMRHKQGQQIYIPGKNGT